MSAKGSGEVTAGDIEAPADLEILNPDLVLAHLSDKGRLDITLTIGRGRGYAPTEGLFATARRRRSASFRSTRSSHRSAASPTRSKRPASDSAPTTTSSSST